MEIKNIKDKVIYTSKKRSIKTAIEEAETKNALTEAIKENAESLRASAVKDLLELRRKIKVVADWYTEKRSDVNEILYQILDGKEPDKSYVEGRYVKWSFNGIDFMYDTLTTLVEFAEGSDHWQEVSGIEYEDDPDE